MVWSHAISAALIATAPVADGAGPWYQGKPPPGQRCYVTLQRGATRLRSCGMTSGLDNHDELPACNIYSRLSVP